VEETSSLKYAATNGTIRTTSAQYSALESVKNQGIRVLRFWNHDMLQRTEKVLEMIREYL
tara:strand:+ start:302 stop:481 length:180 start_codon:yes stop_codon:yes gene_type:complete